MTKLYIALVHHPVLDREGAVVTTAITNLDLHDMARSARTYGAAGFYVIHPIEAQRRLAEKIRDHWVSGSGRQRIPDRADALELIRVVPSMEDVYAEVGGPSGRPALTLWTTAASARGEAPTSYAQARAALPSVDGPLLLVFGTGWGLAPALIEGADRRLEPIRAGAPTGYNHLSVRAACAITLDRLFG